MKKKCNFSRLVFTIAFLILAFQSTQARAIPGNIWVCNKGDINLEYAAYESEDGFVFTSAVIGAYYIIKPGDCEHVLNNGTAVAIAFFQKDKWGNWGNVVYNLGSASRKLGGKRFPKKLCLKISGRTYEKANNMDYIYNKYTPPCPKDHFEASVSFGIYSDGADATINIDASKNYRVTAISRPKVKATPKTEISIAPKSNEFRRHFVIAGLKGLLRSFAFSPDSKTIAVGDRSGVVQIWDIKTKSLLRQLSGHKKVVSIVFSPNGRRLAVGDWASTARLWNARTGKLQYVFGPDNWVEKYSPKGVNATIAFTPDGQTFLSDTGSSVVRAWDVDTGQLKAKFSGDGGYSKAIRVSPNGKILAISSVSAKIKLWEINTKRPIATPIVGWRNSASISFAPNGQLFAEGSVQRNSVKIWQLNNLKTIKLKHHFGRTNSITGLKWSPDGQLLAVRVWYQDLTLWDLKSGRLKYQLKGASDGFDFSSDGLLATGGKHATIWLPKEGKVIQKLGGESASAVAFSPDGNFLAAMGSQSLHLWRR